MALAWNPASKWQLNLKLQRKVGQLNFFDFLASVDVNNNNANGSNPELVPPESWLASVEAIRSLGQYGNIKLTVEGEDITNIVDQVPLGPLVEAPGNLPACLRRFQVTLNAGLLLDNLRNSRRQARQLRHLARHQPGRSVVRHAAAIQWQSLLLERGFPPGRSRHALDLGAVLRIPEPELFLPAGLPGSLLRVAALWPGVPRAQEPVRPQGALCRCQPVQQPGSRPSR